MGDHSLLKGAGPVRTDMYCHECTKNFIAQLDMSIDGNHVVECPHCGHEHCRHIEAGVVTGDRWESRSQRVNVNHRSVWKSDSQPMVTNSASAFMRDRWLNRFNDG